MRIRINKQFGQMTWSTLKEYLLSNSVYNYTVDISDNVLTYECLIMFRSNKLPPEKIYVKVSRTSKLVFDVYTNKRKFNSIKEVLEYTKK
jgi:hypothetical protein